MYFLNIVNERSHQMDSQLTAAKVDANSGKIAALSELVNQVLSCCVTVLCLVSVVSCRCQKFAQKKSTEVGEGEAGGGDRNIIIGYHPISSNPGSER